MRDSPEVKDEGYLVYLQAVRTSVLSADSLLTGFKSPVQGLARF